MPISKLDLESLYREFESPLYNFALRWVFNSALAEETVHEAFVRVWLRRDEVDPATVKPLLYKTVQNLALNEIRKRRVREAFNIVTWFASEETKSQEGAIIESEDLSRMRAALESMPQDLKEVLFLSQFSDFSYEQIASTLNIPAGTVASRKNRALAWLQRKMENPDEKQ